MSLTQSYLETKQITYTYFFYKNKLYMNTKDQFTPLK